MDIMKEVENSKFWRGCGFIEFYIYCWWNLDCFNCYKKFFDVI